MIRPPTRSTLFPYTTLFRSGKTGGTKIKRRQATRYVDWLPAQRMMVAMRDWGEVQKQNYRDILDKSEACLAPFGEPLRVDFGTHGWLKEDREESYSAWLAWIVEQLESPREVFGLFNLEGENAAISDCS